MYKTVKRLFDAVLSSSPVRAIVHSAFGYRVNGWLLGLVGYRATHMIRPGDCCIVAGVYSASTIRDFAKVAGSNGRVIVVEANPENVVRLKRATGALSNVMITNKAIWSGPGEMDFVMSSQERDQGYNRLSSEEIQEFPIHMDDAPRTVKVATDSLDRIAREFHLANVAHINLTINGAELPALDAITEIRKSSPGLRIYINSESPDPAAKVIAKLKELGFKVYTSSWIRVQNDRIRLLRIYAIDEQRSATSKTDQRMAENTTCRAA